MANIIQYMLPMISIVLSLSMIVFSLIKGKKNEVLKAFIFCHVLMVIWIIGQVLENILVNEEHIWNATLLKYTAIIYTGATWLTFCLLYTNRIKNLRKSLILIYSCPTIFNLAILTNTNHHMFFSTYSYGAKTYGIIFWLHALCSYAYLLGSVIILLIELFRCVKKYRIQYILLSISILFPTILNYLYVTRTIKHNSDFTPIGFVFSSLIFFVSVFKYRFLNLLPIAITSILDAIPQTIMVVDSNNDVNYINNAFHTFLPGFTPSIENNIFKFIEYLKQKVYIDEKNLPVLERFQTIAQEPFNGEFEFTWPNQDKPMCYLVYIIPIQERGSIIGQIIMFFDITEYKHLTDENIQKNDALSLIAQKLFEVNCLSFNKLTSGKKDVVAATKESIKLSGEIHNISKYFLDALKKKDNN